MLSLIHRLLVALTGLAGLVGMGFLIGAMLITSVDVVLRKINGEGIFGAVDLVQLMIVSAAFLAIPYTFMKRGHVAVSLFTNNLGRRSSAVIELLAAVLAAVFMYFIAWRGYYTAMDQMMYGDVSMTLGIPLIYYWVPLLTGAGLSVIVALYIGLESLSVAISGHSRLSLTDNQEGSQ